jgi:hypothetical protein
MGNNQYWKTGIHDIQQGGITAGIHKLSPDMADIKKLIIIYFNTAKPFGHQK